MLVFPKAAFMVIDISYQTTMTFLMMFSVILLYILEILLSTQSASGIWSTATSGVDFWFSMWPTNHSTTGVWNASLILALKKKLNWCRLTGLVTLVLMMWKWIGLFLEEKSTVAKKIGAFIFWRYFLRNSPFFSINLPYGLKWNTVVMPGVMALAATWICRVSCRNGYVGL